MGTKCELQLPYMLSLFGDRPHIGSQTAPLMYRVCVDEAERFVSRKELTRLLFRNVFLAEGFRHSSHLYT
uniref:Uncharacterized protein n=1 Tax=Parascaris univalens TaxID=6257 RepID=A0A914ZZ12_PARUN